MLSLANAWSATLLVLGLVQGREGENAGPLLVSLVTVDLVIARAVNILK